MAGAPRAHGRPAAQAYLREAGGPFCLPSKSPLPRHFTKFAWLSRDPRDSYLSCIKPRYTYLFWPRGWRVSGIDVGLLERWKRIQAQHFNRPHAWHLVWCEDLVSNVNEVLSDIFRYLGIPPARISSMKPFVPLSGGDLKLAAMPNVHTPSVGRYGRELHLAQLEVFEEHLGTEMRALGYPVSGRSAGQSPPA